MIYNGDDSFPDKIVVKVDPDMREIVPEFLENARNDVKDLQEALQAEDYETLRILGHSMKGVGAFGFEHLGAVGASLEQAGKGRNLPDAECLVQQLSHYLRDIEVVYE